MVEATAEILARVPLYRALAPEDRALLARVATVRRYDRNDTIFLEGDPSHTFFAIVAGRVKLSKSTPAGRDVILHIFGPGDPLGAVAVYEERPYPASATALEESLCVQIPRADLYRLLESHPTLVRGLLNSLTRRLLELTERLTELSGGHVEERIARLFLKLAKDKGQEREAGLFIPMALSRQELADLTGTTIETCIRIMSRWGKEGPVRTEPDGFLVIDLRALEELAGR
jgi:CRP/FNR family transcriptional regulator